MDNEEYTADEVEEVEEVQTQDEESQDDEAEEQATQRQQETPEAKLARLDRQAKQLRKKLGLDEAKTTQAPTKKSNGLDYGQKAFLVANGVKGEAETKLVQDFIKETGKTLEQVLESKYFQAELSDMRELQATAKATPTGKRSGSMATDSVEYWMTKPIEDVPAEMRTKVVNAKIAKEQSAGHFYNS